jgi:regulator of replication initiation timing
MEEEVMRLLDELEVLKNELHDYIDENIYTPRSIPNRLSWVIEELRQLFI